MQKQTRFQCGETFMLQQCDLCCNYSHFSQLIIRKTQKECKYKGKNTPFFNSSLTYLKNNVIIYNIQDSSNYPLNHKFKLTQLIILVVIIIKSSVFLHENDQIQPKKLPHLKDWIACQYQQNNRQTRNCRIKMLINSITVKKTKTKTHIHTMVIKSITYLIIMTRQTYRRLVKPKKGTVALKQKNATVQKYPFNKQPKRKKNTLIQFKIPVKFPQKLSRLKPLEHFIWQQQNSQIIRMGNKYTQKVPFKNIYQHIYQYNYIYIHNFIQCKKDFSIQRIFPNNLLQMGKNRLKIPANNKGQKEDKLLLSFTPNLKRIFLSYMEFLKIITDLGRNPNKLRSNCQLVIHWLLEIQQLKTINP
eukprot:TRINITY_DN4984_c0_g1_i1.p1 TRINITY_DN4984_c0_g1~~TRINITY_DN4984_c0_g1_i1.p1  ORF type:complete len:359 (-),score=-17.16 TRINITY_DN4984_c0_g1_i1:469-1545(-)